MSASAIGAALLSAAALTGAVDAAAATPVGSIPAEAAAGAPADAAVDLIGPTQPSSALRSAVQSVWKRSQPKGSDHGNARRSMNKSRALFAIAVRNQKAGKKRAAGLPDCVVGKLLSRNAVITAAGRAVCVALAAHLSRACSAI